MCVLLPDPADSLAAAPLGALSEGGQRNERVAAWGSGWAVSAMPLQGPSSFSMAGSTGPHV